MTGEPAFGGGRAETMVKENTSITTIVVNLQNMAVAVVVRGGV